MSILRCSPRAALLALAVLAPAALAAAPVSRRPPSGPAAVRGAQDLMARVVRTKDVPHTLPLLSNRSAAFVGIGLAAFAVSARDMQPPNEGAPPTLPMASTSTDPDTRKLLADVEAVGRRYGIRPADNAAQQFAAASVHGRAFASAIVSVLVKDQSSSATFNLGADELPPVSAYGFAVQGPGDVRIHLRNGQAFPGTTNPYAEAVWEDNQWRLDIGGMPKP